MKGKLNILLILVGLCTLLSMGSGGVARAQQGQDHTPQLDWLFNLDSYQGFEEMPYYGEVPAVDQLAPVSPDVNVPFSKIVFQSFRNKSDWNIFLMDGSGGNVAQLTWDASTDIHPRLNHGCTKIVFASNRNGNFEIYTMNLDGSGVTRLTQNKKDDVYPAWSLDGSLIVFQSYRDGNPEIYIMNSDGTNQIRLTNYSGYDGTPSWSPDGRIVFASDRVASGGIWVMNSDGSGVTELVSQPYSNFPSWSPDGSQVAFSADGNGNGFLELWLVNSDGSNPHLLFDPGPNHDYWVRSWSPDGQYIAMTSIDYIYYNGKWYWTRANLYVWDTLANTPSSISTNNYEWHPDWQTTDALLPVSSMSALPPVSPASFTVSWSGYDQGPSGLRNFDIQVKDGASGSWTNWMAATTTTSSTYTGIGGHTYYFRTRARDNGGNIEAWPPDFDAFTTVEALPPTTSVKPLPAFLRNGDKIQWGGVDPGGSGIQTYDVQYRDTSASTWISWIAGTTDTVATFDGTSGHTYQFRVRATDKAQNVEDWPSGNGDTYATIYLWAVKGSSWDNTGVPVAGMDISTQPNAFESTQSDKEGNYAAYVITDSSNYIALWDKVGYNQIPATTYGNDSDAIVDVVMPPADNIVTDWGFEAGSFGTAWQTSGAITPTISAEQHTGNAAALLGQSFNFLPDVPMTLTNMSDSRSNMALDSTGGVHVVWSETDSGLSRVYYAYRNPDGFWAILRQEISGIDGGASPQIAIDQNQTLHVVWATGAEIYYVSKDPGGVWSDPVNLTNSTIIDSEPQIRVGADNTIHVLWWVGNRDTEYELAYLQKANGVWSGFQYIYLHEMFNEGELSFIVGYDNDVHVFYGGTKCQYTQKGPDGTWTPLERFPNFSGCAIGTYVQFSVDHHNKPHAIWSANNYPDYSLFYAQRGDAGWSDPEKISGGQTGAIALALDSQDIPHVTWCLGSVYYISLRKSVNSWQAPESIPGITCAFSNWSNNIHLQFDDQNTLYLAWASGGPHIMQRKPGEDWTTPWEYASGEGGVFDLAIDKDHKIHILWNTPWQIFYAGPPSADQTGESTISRVIHIPNILTAPTLSFFYNLGGWSTSARSGLDVQLIDNISTTELLSSNQASASWQHAWFDLTPWLSQTITLTFKVHQTEGYFSLWATLDEVTIGSAHPDVWVSLAGSRAAMPGQQVTLQLTYGNRSPSVEALSATLTATLPDGLIFDSASLTPTVNGNVLTWSVGDLPPGSGLYTILVTASVANDAALGSTLTLPVEISTATPELELLNNQQDYALFIGGMVYLPVTVR